MMKNYAAKHRPSDTIHPQPDINRVGYRVKINHDPDIIYEVVGWDETRALWNAKCVVPSNKLVDVTYREDFLAYLDDIGRITRLPE